VPNDITATADQPRRALSTGLLAGFAAVMLLAGGALLDIDRVKSVREALDRAAQLAAIEAAAAPRAADRNSICRKRFNRTVWTDTEVTVDDVSVSVDKDEEGRTATVNYDATVKLAVGRFFGFDEVSISGEAEVPAPERHAAVSVP
jgi:uncharacterized membrane protein